MLTELLLLLVRSNTLLKDNFGIQLRFFPVFGSMASVSQNRPSPKKCSSLDSLGPAIIIDWAERIQSDLTV